MSFRPSALFAASLLALNPEPLHRVDRWFNMTFTPYGPSDTTYVEGEPC